VSFSQGAPDGSLLVPGVALSPDGRRLAFVAQNVTTRKSSIWIRDLASGQIHVVPGTEGGEQPFWSPKSNAIGFFSDGQLKTLDLAGGTPTVIASVGVLPQGGSWSEAGTIVFASWISGLFSVAAAGGPVTPITHIRREMAEFAHRRPQFLPGSKQYVYTIVTGKEATAGTYLGTIGSDERVRIFDTSVTAVQPASAHRIVGLRGGTLIQLALDEHGAVSPEGAQKIDGHIVPTGFQPQFGFSVSPAGLIAFGGGSDRERLMVYTREGKAERALNARSTRNPMLSPRGDQVVAIGRDSQAGIWLIDLERDVSTRITPAGNSPAWSPDGSAIAFGSNQEQGIRDLYLRSISGRPEDKLLLHTDESKTINDWSRDGKYIVYASTNDQRKQDLWLLPMFGERTPIPYLRSGSSQIQAQVSPDGRWMAYTSDESGQWEVYLQSFPTPGMKRTISIGGGGEPRWSADGHELFYMRADKNLMSVSIPGGDPTHGVGSPKVLFTVPVVGDTSTYRSRYTVNARGDRFLFNALDESSQTPITVLVNWESVTAN
jgi:Tol biopolymer transport system component